MHRILQELADEDCFDDEIVTLQSISATQNQPLHMFVIRNEYESFIWALDNGAEINFHGTDDYTPLALACEFKRKEMILELLDRGSDPKRKTYYGLDCFGVAIENHWDFKVFYDEWKESKG